MTDYQFNVNQSLPSRQSCINTVQNTRNSNPTKFVHSLSPVQGKPVIKTKSRLECQRQLMTARGLKKLIKGEKEQVFFGCGPLYGRPEIVNAAIHPESRVWQKRWRGELTKARLGQRKSLFLWRSVKRRYWSEWNRNLEGNCIKSWMNIAMYLPKNCQRVELPRGRLSTLLR